MNGIGYVPVNLMEPDVTGFVNVAKFSDKGVQLDGTNLMECITRAHEAGYSSYFIPAGYYLNPGILIDYNCSIICDSESIFELDSDSSNKYIFRFHKCSVNLTGGKYKSGTFNFLYNDGEDDIGTVGRVFLFPESSTDTYTQSTLIRLIACNNCTLSNIVVPYSNCGWCIRIENSKNVLVQHCKLLSFLEEGVVLFQQRASSDTSGLYTPNMYNTMSNIEVSNCIFKNCMLAYDVTYTNPTTGASMEHGWAHCVSTEVVGNPKSLGDKYNSWEELRDASILLLHDLVYRNNYISGSEDGGLDTHGATNVIIENNRIIDTVNAITAYNDNQREPRPMGYRMQNIIIQNNYCYSERTIRPNSNFPHAYVFVGTSCIGHINGVGWSDSEVFDSCRDFLINNNVFYSANDFGVNFAKDWKGWLDLHRGGYNFTITNNKFAKIGASGATTIGIVSGIQNIVFKNNCNDTEGGFNLVLTLYGTTIEFHDNKGMVLDTSSSNSPSYITGFRNDVSSTYQNQKLSDRGEYVLRGDKSYLSTGWGVNWTVVQKVDNVDTIMSKTYDSHVTIESSNTKILHNYTIDSQTGTKTYGSFSLPAERLHIGLTNTSTGTTSYNYITRKLTGVDYLLNGSVTPGEYILKIVSGHLLDLNTLNELPRS